MTASASIIDIIDDEQLLGPYFTGPSWNRWRAVLKAAFGLRLSRRELDLFHEVAGDRAPPKKPVRELVCIVGRGGGKDAAASAIATYLAVTLDETRLRPGERGSILCLATDREQAAIALGYVKGYFEHVPMLAGMVVRKRGGAADVISLTNGASIIVSTSNFRAPRGRTIVAAVYDECSFWRSDESFSPDFEVDAAVTPGLSRWPGSMKVIITSAYRRQGLAYERYQAAFGQDDPDTLAVLGTSLQFNPTLDVSVIDRELERDRERASAEYNSIWRDDLSTFVSRDVIEQLVDTGITERPPDPNYRYIAFTDEAGGSDASTLAIVHLDHDRRIVQDVIAVWKPPFSPQTVVAEKAALLRQYRITRITGDRWAGGLPPDLYRNHGITFEQSDRVKSDLYVDFLNILNSRRVRLLDHEQTISELLNLERRVRWGGKESIDHPQGASYHDDAANALAGASVIAAMKKQPLQISDELLAHSAVPGYWRRYVNNPQIRPVDDSDLSHVIGRFRL